MGRMTIGAVLAAAMAVIAASCGGDGGTGSALSKEDFISQADAICSKYDSKFTKEIQPTFPAVDPTSSSTSDEDLKKFGEPLNVTHDLRNDQVDELRALAPPEDFQEQWNTVLAFLDSSVAALAKAADAIGNADRPAVVAAFAKGQKGADEADRIAKAYGFKVCGQS